MHDGPVGSLNINNDRDYTMAGSVNKVILIGNLGRDPALSQFEIWKTGMVALIQ